MNNKKAIPLQAQGSMAKFESARETLRAFEREHSRVLEDYAQLRGSYNSAIEEVKEVYRNNHEAIGAHFGDFSLRYRVEVDGGKLASMMGDDAVRLGIVSYEPKVDRKKYDKALAEGMISASIVAEVETHPPPAVVSPKKAE
jgi:hypothetical protein